MAVTRFQIYLVAIEPTVGSEIHNTRPCVVISPDISNRMLRTVIVAPLTRSTRRYPSRVPCRVNGEDGSVVVDQIRTVDQSRLVRLLDELAPETATRLLKNLREFFAE